MRDLGLQAEVERDGTPNHLMGDTVFCTSLAGDELARLHTWGTHPARHADYALASPCLHIDLPQTYFEPILVRAAGERGSRLRFNTEFLSFEQDADGVTATRAGPARAAPPMRSARSTWSAPTADAA